jgi:uncharacterized sodium:solute symporter family permease YidK
MEEFKAFLELLVANTIGPNPERFVYNLIGTVPLLIVLVLIIGAFKKKETQTTVQTRFTALQNRLIKALQLEKTAFLTAADEIHEEYNALLEAYQKLYGSEEQKK